MKTLLSLLFVALAGISFAQNSGEIFGKLLDETNQPVVGSVVRATNNANTFGAASNINGNFRISGLNPGKYDVLVVTMGFDSLKIQDVIVKADQITRVGELELMAARDGVIGPIIHVRAYKTELIDINGGTMISMGAGELLHSPAAHGGNIKQISTKFRQSNNS